MHVNLYPQKQLQQSIKYMLVLGVFLMAGGVYAFIREVFLSDEFRVTWAISSTAVFVAGLTCFFVSNNRHVLKEAYFSMSPDRIKYRLAVLGRERVIYWEDVRALDISAHTIVYQLKSGSSIQMRLGHIQQPEVMLHVSRSIHLAAMEKGIMVNGIQTARQNTVA